jgi:hypothetical protein
MGFGDGHDLAVNRDLSLFGFDGKVLMVVCRDGIGRTLGHNMQTAIGMRASQPGWSQANTSPLR